ncbi:hypothetical protein B0H13DRAFT_1851298 [Mycena leptocephala]|nr:hypothetical protein B0H13DRAFT_1851298 [Mycena leptocephala]
MRLVGTLRLENEAQRKQAADNAEAERVRDKHEKELKTLHEKQNAEREKIQKTYDDILAEHEAAEMESDKLPHPMALNPPAASTVISLVESDDEDDGIEIISGPKKSVDGKRQRLVHQFTMLTSSLNEEQVNVLGQNLEHVVNTAISTKCLVSSLSLEEDEELAVNPPSDGAFGC